MNIQYFLFPALMLLVQNVQFLQSATLGASDGFYWRPFNGTIPKDALPTTDDTSRPSYIGRGYVWNGGMYIGEILPNADTLIVTGQPGPVVHVVTENIEILCTTTPNNFEWVVRASGDPIFPDVPYLVQAGYAYEVARPQLVGRASVPLKLPNSKESSHVIKPAKFALNEPERDAYERLWYANGTVEGAADLFEVLLVKNN